MSKIKDDTVGGFNTFLNDQRQEDGKATVSLYEFDTDVRRVYDEYPIADTPELDGDRYTPGGRTALHDALYRVMDETATRLEARSAANRPTNVIIVVLTDGKENASETSQDRVREQVRLRREEQEWEFLFIGANQDAALTAEKMGMDSDRSLDMAHSGEGAQAAYESASEQVRTARETGQTDGFTPEDRRRQEEARDS